MILLINFCSKLRRTTHTQALVLCNEVERAFAICRVHPTQKICPVNGKCALTYLSFPQALSALNAQENLTSLSEFTSSADLEDWSSRGPREDSVSLLLCTPCAHGQERPVPGPAGRCGPAELRQGGLVLALPLLLPSGKRSSLSSQFQLVFESIEDIVKGGKRKPLAQREIFVLCLSITASTRRTLNSSVCGSKELGAQPGESLGGGGGGGSSRIWVHVVEVVTGLEAWFCSG